MLRKCSRSIGALGAALGIAGMLAGGAVAPASAADETGVSPGAQPVAPLSDEARAAALEVLEYVTASPLPPVPAVGAPKEAWTAPAAARAAFYRSFPIEAGTAQWGCQVLGDGIDVAFTPETFDEPAAYGYSFGLECDGYRPTNEEIFAPRPDAVAAVAPAEVSGERAGACATIAGGQHCITFPAEVVGDYIWLGSLMYGRIRIGQASVVAPACNSANTVLASSVHTLHENQGIRLGYIRNQSANWSLTFDQANSAGQITGVRSVFCQTG
jgi:hypothetical protein